MYNKVVFIFLKHIHYNFENLFGVTCKSITEIIYIRGLTMLKRLVFTTLISVSIVGLISVIIVWNMNNYYTATVLLVMTPVPLNVRENTPNIISGDAETPYRVSYLTVSDIPTFPMPDYEQIFLSDEIVEKVLLYLADKEEYKNVKLSRTKLRNSLSIKSKIFFQGTNQIQYQRIIQLQFTSTNPQLSVEVCNMWADLGMNKIEELRKQPIQEGIEYLEKELAQKQTQLAEMKEKLFQLNSSYHLPSLESRIQEMEDQITRYKLQQYDLSIEIARLEQELASQNLGNRIQNEPQKTPIPASDHTLNEDETSKTSKETLDEIKKTLKIKTEEQRALQRQIEAIEKELNQLRQLFATTQKQKNNLENEIAILTRLTNDLNISYQLGKSYLEKTQCELRIASKALTPRQKAGPPRTLYVMCVIVLTTIAIPTIYIATVVSRYYFEKLEKEFSV